jgi:hypothetical protein
MTPSNNSGNPPIQDDDSPPLPHSGLIGDAHGFLIGQRRISDGLTSSPP